MALEITNTPVDYQDSLNQQNYHNGERQALELILQHLEGIDTSITKEQHHSYLLAIYQEYEQTKHNHYFSQGVKNILLTTAQNEFNIITFPNYK